MILEVAGRRWIQLLVGVGAHGAHVWPGFEQYFAAGACPTPPTISTPYLPALERECGPNECDGGYYGRSHGIGRVGW
jgi:hypothetical protein